MKSNTFWADKIADLISEGYTSDESILRVSNEIAKKRIPLKVGNIVKEFKKVYGLNPHSYELNIITSTVVDVIDEELYEEFKSFGGKS
jgi:hypothetical protein